MALKFETLPDDVMVLIAATLKTISDLMNLSSISAKARKSMKFPRMKVIEEEQKWKVLAAQVCQLRQPKPKVQNDYSLDLSECGIGPEAVLTVSEILNADSFLKKLNLSGNKICGLSGAYGQGTYSNVGITKLGHAIKNAALTSLVLNGNNIGDQGAATIAEGLRFNGILTSLDVGFNRLTEEGALGIVRVERQRNKLTSLGLGHCNIGPTGAAEIAEYVSDNGVLTNLNLSWNNIRDEGAKALASALHVNKGLTNLNLSFNHIRDDGAGEIATALHSSNRALTDLDLRENDIGPYGATYLVYALKNNKVLTKLNLGVKESRKLDLPKLRGTNPVTSLNFLGRGLQPPSIIVIASLIVGNKVLTDLNLCNNDIWDDSAEAIEAIGKALGNGVLKRLNLSHNYIGDVGAVALGKALAVKVLKRRSEASAAAPINVWTTVSAVLTDLNLRNNRISDRGAEAIGKALDGNGELKTLDLRNNFIHAEGAAAIAGALRGNGVLTNLNLSENEIGDEGVEALASALRVNGGLTTLDLRANDFGDEAEGVIRDAVSGRVGFELKMDY